MKTTTARKAILALLQLTEDRIKLMLHQIFPLDKAIKNGYRGLLRCT